MFSLTKHKEILKYAKKHLSQAQYNRLKWAYYTNKPIVIEDCPETQEQQIILRNMIRDNDYPAFIESELCWIEVNKKGEQDNGIEI